MFMVEISEEGLAKISEEGLVNQNKSYCDKNEIVVIFFFI
jgi:hypothetical protein